MSRKYWNEELDKLHKEIVESPDDTPAKEHFLELFKQLGELNKTLDAVENEMPEKLKEIEKRIRESQK